MELTKMNQQWQSSLDKHIFCGIIRYLKLYDGFDTGLITEVKRIYIFGITVYISNNVKRFP